MENIRLYIAILLGMIVKLMLKLCGKDATSAPGKIALKIYPRIIKEIDKRCKLKILISGTNGKTTTNNIINWLIADDRVVLSNLKGSNMANGIVSAFINNLRSNYDIACFEVDEGSLPIVTRYLKPDIFVTTNVFRDQLDRYGELDRVKDLILDHIGQALAIINADDPNLASFSGEKRCFIVLMKICLVEKPMLRWIHVSVLFAMPSLNIRFIMLDILVNMNAQFVVIKILKAGLSSQI